MVATGVVATAPPALAAPPKWVQRIDDVVGRDAVSVTIGYEGATLYRHKDWVGRAPASNEKLLLSMALLDQVPPDTTIPTRVLATKAVRDDGTLRGDLWIVGHGDPETDRQDLAALAADLQARGVERVRGRVMGSTGPFGRDWFAPGWKSYFPRYYIALPTALTYRYNRGPRGRNVNDPERRAAAELTKQLQQRGIKVRGKAGMGTPPGDLVGLATRESEPFVSIMRRMNVFSSNFRAEVFGKFLGARVGGRGTIARGARAIEAFTQAHGVGVEANDGSGLSYANRVSTEGIVDLLWAAEASPVGRDPARHAGAGRPGHAGGSPARREDPREDRHPHRHLGALGMDLARTRGCLGRVLDPVPGDEQDAFDPDRERDRSRRERQRRSPLTGIGGGQSSARSRGCSRPNV